MAIFRLALLMLGTVWAVRNMDSLSDELSDLKSHSISLGNVCTQSDKALLSNLSAAEQVWKEFLEGETMENVLLLLKMSKPCASCFVKSAQHGLEERLGSAVIDQCFAHDNFCSIYVDEGTTCFSAFNAGLEKSSTMCAGEKGSWGKTQCPGKSHSTGCTQNDKALLRDVSTTKQIWKESMEGSERFVKILKSKKMSEVCADCIDQSTAREMDRRTEKCVQDLPSLCSTYVGEGTTCFSAMVGMLERSSTRCAGEKGSWGETRCPEN